LIPLLSATTISLLVIAATTVVFVCYCPDVPGPESYRLLSSANSEIWTLTPRVELSRGVDPDGSLMRTEAHIRCWRDPSCKQSSEDPKLSIVCVHGTFSSSHEFEEWAEELQRKSIAANMAPPSIFAVDLPGHGLTGPWTDSCGTPEYSMDADVAFLHEILHRPEFESRNVVLVGHSLGGSVASAYAARWPENVAGVVLIAPWGLQHGSKDNIMKQCVWFIKLVLSPRWRFLSVWVCLLFIRVTPRMLVRYAISTAFGPGAPDAGEAAPERAKIHFAGDRMHALMLRAGNRRTFVTRVAHFIAQERHAPLARARCCAQLKEIQCPVQLQWGDADKWLSVERCTAWAQMLGSRAVDICRWPGVGHCVTEQIPGRSAEAVLAFIQRFIIARAG